MFSFALRRPRIIPEWRDWLPALALPLFMFAALLALGGDRGYFYRGDDGIHDDVSAKTLAIADNLSPKHRFLLAGRVWRDEDGGFRYDLYSRFPVGGYLLAKAATLPFGRDLAARLLAGRVLAMLTFCGAALLAYLAAARIARSRRTALAAALLAFSGFYPVFYADAVFSEGVMDLFGAALVFHGMTVFVQEGRFRQLLVKTCAALLLGWHVYALILPFVAIGLGGEAAAHTRSALSARARAVIPYARAAALSLARSRYAALAAVAILFGSALLALNLANEYAAYSAGRATMYETPTFQSILRRFGRDEDFVDYGPGLEWSAFLRRQFYRVGAASVPYAAARAVGWDFPTPEPIGDMPLAPTVLGVAAACAALGALALVRRYRILMATAVLFGFCWAIPMRRNTFYHEHFYEGMLYAALALALYAAALGGARRLLGARVGGAVAIAAAAIAAPIFALSVFHAGQLERDAAEAEREKNMMADFSAIRQITRGERVRVVSDPGLLLWTGYSRWEWDYSMRYYLSGSRLGLPVNCARADDADFAVAFHRYEGLETLTPENQIAFLYAAPDAPDAPEMCRAERRRLESLQPAARSVFDVYLGGGAVGYLKAPCEPRDYAAPFFAWLYPANLSELPPERRRDGFRAARGPIRLADAGAAFDGACLMTLRLPDYPIAAIRTGQYPPGGERVWDVFITPPPSAEALALYEKIYQDVSSSGEPAARSGGFDLYLNGDALSYLKEPCAADDARGRFFLSVHPANLADLPAARREIGHESLNFDFAPPSGAVFNGKCMATRQLPDYDIAKIETGQWVPGGERLWAAEIVVGR